MYKHCDNVCHIPCLQLLLLMMEEVKADYTMTFRELCDWDLKDMRENPENIPDEVRLSSSFFGATQFFGVLRPLFPLQLLNLNKLKQHKQWQHWLKDVYVPKLMQAYQAEGPQDTARLKAFQKKYPDWTDDKRRAMMKVRNNFAFLLCLISFVQT